VKLRTIGLVIGVILGACVGYAQAEALDMKVPGGTLSLKDEACKNGRVVLNAIRLGAPQEALAALKEGSGLSDDKTQTISFCYDDKTVKGQLILIFEEPGEYIVLDAPLKV
jgi:hypothetical protein